MPNPKKVASSTLPCAISDVITDASWSGRWTRFSVEDLEAYFRDVADWSVLDVLQMEHLIQGLPPPLYCWLPTHTSFAEFSPIIRRLKEDISQGAISSAPTVREFAAWCDQRGVELPASLVERLRARSIIPSPMLSQTSPAIVIPAWVPFAHLPKVITRTKTARGRPRTAAPKYKALESDGRDILMAAARAGVKKTIAEIAKALQNTPCGQGMDVASIARRLKGKLPITQAHATATKHQLRTSKR